MERKLTEESYKKLRKLILQESAQFSHFVMLDSCSHPGALEHDTYECIAAMGVKNLWVGADPEGIDACWQPGKWVFPIATYELKNSIENLESVNPSLMPVPPMIILEPLTVIVVTRSLELEVFGEWPPFDLFHETTDHSEPEVLPMVEMEAGMDRPDYLQRVALIQQEIGEGNVYELNLCYPCVGNAGSNLDPRRLYSELTSVSPVPYAAFIRIGEHFLICASPERFLRKQGDLLLTQPIKGTTRRSVNVAENARLQEELRHSEKERAENVMIVDLVRNDLSRVCRTGTVEVLELFGIYPFAQVFQMISSICGRLEPDMTFAKILRATFPMGSMTGAPKIAAMEIIDQMEDYQRGWYSGSVGYINPQGDMDLNVIIRSLLYHSSSGTLLYSVGGAITIDSDAADEWAETKLKASAMEAVLRGTQGIA